MKWVAIDGSWEFDNKTAIYKGPSKDETNRNFGIAIIDNIFHNGDIKLKIKLNDSIDGSSANLIFGYSTELRQYYYLGLGNWGKSYVLAEFSETKGWSSIDIQGNCNNLKDKEYLIDVNLRGQKVFFLSNSINVITNILPHPLLGNQLGVMAWGKKKITFEFIEIKPTNPKCFVVMQYGEPYDSLYSEVIKPILLKKLDVYRADEIYKPGIILQDIIKGIIESEIIVAEITPPNPNVFYELGYAHALNKTTILLAERNKDLPFDIKGYRCIFYNDTIKGKTEVENELLKHLNNIFDESH